MIMLAVFLFLNAFLSGANFVAGNTAVAMLNLCVAAIIGFVITERQ